MEVDGAREVTLGSNGEMDSFYIMRRSTRFMHRLIFSVSPTLGNL